MAIDQEMLICKTGGKVQKFHTFSTVLLFAASGGAFVVVGLDTGFCGRVISYELAHHWQEQKQQDHDITTSNNINNNITTPPPTETSDVNNNKISTEQIDLGVDDDSGTYRYKSSHSVESEGNAKEGPAHLDDKISRSSN